MAGSKNNANQPSSGCSHHYQPIYISPLILKETMKKTIIALIIAATLATGCTRIETGEVGVRLNANKEIEGAEMLPGSWNQTLIGSVLEFPVRDIIINISDKKYQTSDSAALDDFDVTFVYSINPASVSEIYSTKSRAFHVESKEGIYLMYAYMETLVNNAAYKAVRAYAALEVADKREAIERAIYDSVVEKLKGEKLDVSIIPGAVTVRSIMPNKEILASATRYVSAQNELRVKQTEVDIAKKESERMAALSSNSTASIAYMNAQATLNISEGIKAGKVQTIVVPSNMTGLMINK